MKKYFLNFMIISLCLSTVTLANSYRTKKESDKVVKKTQGLPLNRSSPTDSSLFAVEVNNRAGTIQINGENVSVKSDSLHHVNYYSIDKSGNKVSVIQDNESSKIEVYQTGRNNQIKIIQQNQ